MLQNWTQVQCGNLDTCDFDTKMCKDSMHWGCRSESKMGCDAKDCDLEVCSHLQTCLFTSTPENIMGAAFSPFQNLKFGELKGFDT